MVKINTNQANLLPNTQQSVSDPQSANTSTLGVDAKGEAVALAPERDLLKEIQRAIAEDNVEAMMQLHQEGVLDSMSDGWELAIGEASKSEKKQVLRYLIKQFPSILLFES